MQEEQQTHVSIGDVVRKALNLVEKPRSETDVLVFDTETTGIPDYKSPSESEHQPHMTELCGLRFTAAGELIGAVSMLVMPNGWEIPKESSDLNGLTQELCLAQGSDEGLVLGAFMGLWEGCAVRVAHNRTFDDRIIRIGLMRYADETAADAFKVSPAECTAVLAKPICKLPATDAMKKTNFKNSFKTPNLAEAFKHVTGLEMAGAHRAYEDAIACARVYFAIKGVRMPDFPNDLDHLNYHSAVSTESEAEV